MVKNFLTVTHNPKAIKNQSDKFTILETVIKPQNILDQKQTKTEHSHNFNN